MWDAQIILGQHTFIMLCQKALGTWSVHIHSCFPRGRPDPQTPVFPLLLLQPLPPLPRPPDQEPVSVALRPWPSPGAPQLAQSRL